MAGTEATHTPHRSGRSAVRTCIATISCILTALTWLVVAAASDARAVTPEILLGRPRVGEYQPVRGDDFLAWQQNTRAHPGHYDVFARPLDGGGKFKVNAAGTNGANGSIDGDVLVYQQFRFKRSDLKFFDLVDRSRSSPPAGVNTDQWEYWPSMSGNWLLFARLYGSGVRRMILFDLSTGDSRRLAEVRGGRAFLAPGQVTGDWAVWSTCRSETVCNVIRYFIPDGTRETIPNDGARQHAPSVTPDGTVYFARSNAKCGGSVKVVRHAPNGNETVLWRIQSGDEVGSTETYTDREGITTVLFDQYDCGRAAEADSWNFAEDFAPELSVTLEGDADGTVTSSPPGINCGNDCTESYDSGTGVTLTAEPEDDAEFAGWSGACTGTDETCTLTMNGPKSVTATFTNNPVLTVEKTGSGLGTVTSNPAGINCGGDCNEPYAPGTTVTLTAEPEQGSTFEGWSGACGGTNVTCTVPMNGNKSVTATFGTQSVTRTLIVTVTGPGSVTSAPGQINCTDGNAGVCQDTFNDGATVTLTATGTVTWGGDCATELDNTCDLTMNADKSATATFV